jgi:hypothetical protein
MLAMTKRVTNFLLQILEDGFVTKKKLKIGTFGYYSLVWYCRDNNLIKAKINDGDNQKRWYLSPLGKEVTLHLKAIKDLTEGKKEDME